MAVSLASMSSVNGGVSLVKFGSASIGAVKSRVFGFENGVSCSVSHLRFFLYLFSVRWCRGVDIGVHPCMKFL